MFKISDHIEFDHKGRAQCPVCLSDGKKGKNLALIPNTDGAYKCHRGCTPQDIRAAIGQPKSENSGDRIVPTNLAKPSPKPKYLDMTATYENKNRLLFESKLAKQWLADRGITEEDINTHCLGLVFKVIEGKKYPCITIRYRIESDKYLQKYFVAPWLPSDQRGDHRIKQDVGLSARWWFTTQGQDKSNKDLFICEGEWDAILLSKLSEEYDCCTSTTGAGNIPADLSELDHYENIYIWYDLDDAGKKGAEKLQAKLGDRAKICTVPHPENCKSGYDVSDAIRDGYKLEDFLEATKSAIGPQLTTAKKSSLKSRLTTTAELMARAKDYTDWLIDEILPINELILLAASPRAGKSLMAMNIAQCVASGTNFLDRPVTQGNVIYVQCEDSETKTKQRLIAQGWDENLPVYWLDKFKLSELPELIELSKQLEPRLIVLDTLSRIRDDNATESSAEMGRVLEPLQEFARDHNCCILPIHHTGKIKTENADTLDVFETIRGSSAIRATCRGTLVIAANTDGYRLCIENGYNKQDLKVSLNLTDLTWKLLGRWGVQVNESLTDQVLAFLTKCEHATLEQIYDATTIKKDSLYKTLSRLVQQNLVTKTGSRKQVLYSRMNSVKPLSDISDISDMSDNLSDTQMNTEQSFESYRTKNNFSNTAITSQVQNSVDALYPNSSKLSDCPTTGSNPDSVSVLESDKISDKPNSVRLEIGDRVKVRSPNFLAGKVGEVLYINPNDPNNQVTVGGKDWAINQGFKFSQLERIKK